jgi:uncharacterized delta-60 repeat protein
VLRYLAAAVTLAAFLLAAGISAGAERPGTVARQIALIDANNDVGALGVMPDRRVVVAGTTRIFSDNGGWVRAYLPDGGPDNEFGEGGTVRFEPDYREVAAMLVQPDGRILVARTGNPGQLHRLHANGSPDASFGTGGTVDLDFGGRYIYFVTLAIQADGRFVVVANPIDGTTSPQPRLVRRYLPDGSLDPSFGTNGEVTVWMPDAGVLAAVAVQPDERLVLLLGSGSGAPRIARLLADGRLDPGFGRGGLAPIELGRRRWADDVHVASDPLVLPDGRIRIPVSFGGRRRIARVGIVGLTSDGRVDRRFGREGLALGPRQPFAEGGEFAQEAVLDSSGSILVAGTIAHGDDLSGDDSAIVRRFLRNGALDRSFGRRGLVRGTRDAGGQTIQLELAMLDGDTFVLAEQETIPKYQSFNFAVLHSFHAGYDRDDPQIAILQRRCRSLRVSITDLSGMERVVVRAAGRVIRRTSRKQFRARFPEGARWAFVRAIDLAGNSSGKFARLPRC